MDFLACLDKTGTDVKPLSLSKLWMNITRQCNQSCSHCHVGSSPSRTESMDPRTLEKCLEVLAATDSCREMDLTGGAPELHQQFEYLVSKARLLGKRVTVRHNLTVIGARNPASGRDMSYLPDFFAAKGVHVLASLPHYSARETDEIRGAGVFEKSIRSIRLLNEAGYGKPGTGLVLDIVYNVNGPVSTAERESLEAVFKKKLYHHCGVMFNSLVTVTNVPIGRYGQSLGPGGRQAYLKELEKSFSPEAVSGLVCRSMVSVGYDGSLYDCDFNQMLGLRIEGSCSSIHNFDLHALLERSIRFSRFCFGCTAGGGSS